jgi:hypothetical protein
MDRQRKSSLVERFPSRTRKRISMTHGAASPQFERLQVGQAVEVRRGSLAGIVGLLIGYSPNRNCQIQLDTLERGVTLIIDPAAVGARKLTA